MNRKTGVILLVVIAVLGSLAYYVNANPTALSLNTPTPVPTTSASRPLWTIDATQITGLTVSDSATGKTFVADADNTGAWKMSQPVSADVDLTQLSSILTTVSTLYITQEIDDATNLDQFGLESPAYGVEVRLTGGEPMRFTVGQKAVTGFGYYVRLEGSPTPVLVPTTSLDTLLVLPSQPPIAIPTEAPTEAGTLEPLPTMALPATATP